MEHTASTIISASSTSLSRFAQTLWQGHLQAANDFRARWRRCGLWFLIGAWLALLSFIFIEMLRVGQVTFMRSDDGPCMPNGLFGIDPSEFRFFSSSGFFQITMGFGNMNFTQAKAVDVAWDIAIGRGGQALIAYISWRTFTNYVTTSMEIAPITFRTYRTIFLPGGSLLVDILRMIRDFSFRHGLHSKIAMCFMIFTMVFTLVFPTFASAMTGYNGKVEPFVNTTDSNYVPFGSFYYAVFVIHDGWRIDKEEEHIVIDSDGAKGSSPTVRSEWDSTYCDSDPLNRGEAHCKLLFGVADYVRQYGLDGKATNSSIFLGRELPPPVLNISAFYLNRQLASKSAIMESTHYDDRKDRMRWAYENSTYKWEDMQQRGKCQAVLDYQWGFSFIQLFMMVIILIIWTSGILVMWLTSHFTMKRRARKEVAGGNKAILELSYAMRKQLREHTTEAGENDSTITESVLSARIKKDLQGGSISYPTPLRPDGDSIDKWTFLNWIKSNKWSISATCFYVALAVAYEYWIPFFCLYLLTSPLGCSTLSMGSTRKSRGVFFFWSFIAFGIATFIISVYVCNWMG